MSSPSPGSKAERRESRREALVAEGEASRMLAAETDRSDPAPVWKRKVLDGKTSEEMVARRPVTRQFVVRANEDLFGAVTRAARAAGMSRQHWMRHVMAKEIVTVAGGDYDALVGGFGPPPVWLRIIND